MIRTPLLFLVGLLFLLAGCGPTMQQQAAQTNAQLQTFVGVKTYDEFVSRMGPPLQQTDSGSRLVAVWGQQSTGYITTTNFAVPVNHGERIVAEFDKQTKVLTAARYEKW